MPHLTTADVIDDPGLPALAKAFDPDIIVPLLVEAARVVVDDGVNVECSIEVLKHWPAKRCTVRYSLWTQGDPAVNVATLIGKIYHRPELAVRASGSLGALRQAMTDESVLAASLGVMPELGLSLQHDLPGELLSEQLTSNTSTEPLYRLGRWLADLHTSAPIPGVRSTSAATESERVEERLDIVSPILGSDEADDLQRRMRNRVNERADEEPSWSMTHRDFYPGNVLLHARAISVIDFDWLALGDPAVDVGGFMAQAQKLSWLRTGTWHEYSRQVDAFERAYLETGPVLDAVDRDGAMAGTFLNLAADEVRRRSDPDWRERARSFAVRANELLDLRNGVSG